MAGREYRVRAAISGESAVAASPVPASLSFTDSDGFLHLEHANPPLQFDLAEVAALEAAPGSIRIRLLDGQAVRLTALGPVADELTSELSAAIADRTARCFRFGRAIDEGWAAAEVTWPDGARQGARVRVFEASVAVLPNAGEPARIRLGEVRRVGFDEGRYQVVVEMAGGSVWRLGKLAGRTTPWLEALREAVQRFNVAYQTQLKDVLPDVAPPALRELSATWLEGHALPGNDLDRVSAGASARLLAHLPDESRRPFVTALDRRAMARALGFYFSPDAAESGGAPFIPYGLFTLPGGRATAWETLGGETLATYVFCGGAATVAEIDAALRDVAFAREPIYLAEDELKTSAEYRHHVPLRRRSAALRLLRERLVGRVIHADPETYPAALEHAAARA